MDTNGEHMCDQDSSRSLALNMRVKDIYKLTSGLILFVIMFPLVHNAIGSFLITTVLPRFQELQSETNNHGVFHARQTLLRSPQAIHSFSGSSHHFVNATEEAPPRVLVDDSSKCDDLPMSGTCADHILNTLSCGGVGGVIGALSGGFVGCLVCIEAGCLPCIGPGLAAGGSVGGGNAAFSTGCLSSAVRGGAVAGAITGGFSTSTSSGGK
mmetsp:Transcript_36363/g.77425  ORF Transcript_36363/g.77425 Transcript_36363/m.77425 type:complete len:211 (+) Transcript_36363:74-706(+)